MHATDPQPKLLTIQEVADLLHVSPRTVRGLIYARQLPSTRMGRQIVRVSEDAVRAYVHANTTEARA